MRTLSSLVLLISLSAHAGEKLSCKARYIVEHPQGGSDYTVPVLEKTEELSTIAARQSRALSADTTQEGFHVNPIWEGGVYGINHASVHTFDGKIGKYGRLAPNHWAQLATAVIFADQTNRKFVLLTAATGTYDGLVARGNGTERIMGGVKETLRLDCEFLK